MLCALTFGELSAGIPRRWIMFTPAIVGAFRLFCWGASFFAIVAARTCAAQLQRNIVSLPCSGVAKLLAVGMLGSYDCQRRVRARARTCKTEPAVKVVTIVL